NRTLATIAVPGSPMALAYDHGTREVYVATPGNGNVTVLSDTTNSVVATIPVPSAYALAYDEGTGEVYVAGFAANLSVLSDVTHSVVATVPTQAVVSGLLYNPSSSTVYVAEPKIDRVAVVSDANHTVVDSVPVGSHPVGLAYDARTSEVYVAIGNGSEVQALQGLNPTTVVSIPVQASPRDVAYDPGSGRVFVTDAGTSNVSSISDATHSVDATLAVGTEPLGIASDAAGGRLAVTNFLSGTLTILTGGGPAAGPSIASFAATPSSIAVGDETNFTVVVSGGSGPLSYAYAGLPPGCSSQNASIVPCRPTAAGSYDVTVTVSDAVGRSANASSGLVVSAPNGSPLSVTVSITPAAVALGGSTTIAALASGGTPPYSYAYTGLPAGCPSVDQASWACSPTSTGSYSVTVDVTDAVTAMASTSAALTVTVGGALTVTLSATPSVIDLGNATTLVATVTGGAAPYTFAYSGLPSGCATGDTASLACTPSEAGVFTLRVVVTDPSGARGESNASLQVTGPGHGPVPASSSGFPILWLLVGAAAIGVGATSAVLYRRARKSRRAPREPPPDPAGP
ncbi:MAG TPA: YncE family protein, partial [Thermoplasmata archaeon]